MDRLNEYQYERWKERAKKIRALDGNKCALCGAKGVLHVHHLAYPPAPFHLWDCRDDELVTLCPECHKKVHQAPFRIELDEKTRQIYNFIDVEEYERMGEEMEEHMLQFRKDYIDARLSGQCCCANCLHGSYAGDCLECNIRIEEDRDFFDVPPTYYCDNYKEDVK